FLSRERELSISGRVSDAHLSGGNGDAPNQSLLRLRKANDHRERVVSLVRSKEEIFFRAHPRRSEDAPIVSGGLTVRALVAAAHNRETRPRAAAETAGINERQAMY
ncbi:MAG TPA: hypothetical protein VFE63_20150, partial [Roseiarcus sp.]|nr:hypothetical protein [Roseiarcus sp.]